MGRVFIHPEGTGDRSGSSVENAATFEKIAQLMTTAGPGGEVIVLAPPGATYYAAGPFPIGPAQSGQQQAPITVRGATPDGANAHPVIIGSRKPGPGGGGTELFRFRGGADFLRFRSLEFRNHGNGVFRIGGPTRGLDVSDVGFTNVHRFVENYVTGQAKDASLTDSTFSKIEGRGFERGFWRLGYDSRNVVAEDISADSMGQVGEPFTAGCALTGRARAITYRRVSMTNCKATGKPEEYWNGDGFSDERENRDIRYEDVYAAGCTDGGLDIKSTDATIVRPIVKRNKRNIRVWASARVFDFKSSEPLNAGGVGGSAHFWVAAGGSLTLYSGAFENSGAAALIDTSEGSSTVRAVGEFRVS